MTDAAQLPWRRICCAIDLSPASRAALTHAISVARASRAELILVHARARTGGGTLFAPPARKRASEEAGDALARWTAYARETVPVTTSVEPSGSPAEAIVRVVEDFSCDLIVIATHGRSSVFRAALGSVAENVLRLAPCPVLVVHASAV